MGKQKTEPTKIFFDMLFDYKYLKYIFKYGFYWDDEITMFLLSKSSQRVRELAKTISKSVYKNCVSTLWCEYTNSGLKKKSRRRLVRQNHYRLQQNRWFQDLCGCCGNYQDENTRERMEKCREDADGGGGYGSYNDCKEDENSCPCRKLCMFEEERATFLELLDEPLRGGEVWRANVVHELVWKSYKDIIIEQADNRISLKENIWSIDSGEIEEDMEDLPHSEEQEWDNFKRSPEFKRFSDMVCFFSGFTPLSALGWIFYKRQRYGTGTSYIMVRNLPIEFEFEQEYIYRCLYAMNEKKTIICEEKEYIPVRLFYKDRSLTGIKEHLYLEAIPWEEQGTNPKTEQIPLFGGVHVRPGWRTTRELLAQGEILKEDTRDFQVEFYYNNHTEYLVERRREGWGQYVADTQSRTGVKIMESPYYEDKNQWDIDVVTYRIEISDIPGFLMFIRSFGDFARLVSWDEDYPELKQTISVRQKGYISEYESLLSVYNSDILIEEAAKKNRCLPPRQAELKWLDFVIREYPGFCGMFLEPENIELIREKLKEEPQDSENPDNQWFDRSKFNFGPRVKDLDNRVCRKYKKILNVIYNRQILKYEYHNRQVRIAPYALEYDVTRHLAGGSREPMDIMCYDLDEKRTVNIPYKKINTKNSANRDEYFFSDLEKMYHALAYAIRCGTEGIEKVGNEKARNLLENLWPRDSRGNDNYTRCVRKKLKKARDYACECQRFEKLCENHQKPEAEVFFHRVFDYWKTVPKDSETYQYQAFLLSCLSDGCKRLWSPRTGREVREALDQMDSQDIWELIAGDGKDGIVNEITFYNERLKNTTISFVLKDRSEEAIEKVYNVFRNFVCAGEKLEDGRLRFTVSYEMFFYRKIHMALMALDSLIEEVEPRETEEVIKKRIMNKEEA